MALLGVQEPRLSHVPEGDDARGEEAVQFARWCGLTLYPWQEDLLRDMCRTGEDGNWAAREAVVVVPRQNGKGEVLVARELAGIYLFGEKSIGHSAHFMDTAQDAQKRLWEVIEGNDNLMYWWEDDPTTPGVPHFGRTNGKENISFPTGQEVLFRTRTDKTFRGLSLDLVIFDECFNLPNEINAAMSKTTRAKERAQRIYISSPVDQSVHMHGAIFSAKRWAAIDGADGVLFKEWSPAEDADIFAQETWAACNPSLVDRGPGAQLSDTKGDATAARSSEVLRRQFMVESLGWGDWYPRDGDVVDDFVPIVDVEAWSAASALMPSSLGESCLAVDVTPDGESVGVVSAAAWGDRVYLSLAPYEEFDRSLVVEKVASTVRLNDPSAVVLDPSGQCSTLVEPMRGIGVAPETLSGAQVSKAYELFLRMWAEKRIAHDGQQRWLDALEVAQERSKNGRYRSLDRYSGDVTVLVAASLAVWGLQEFGIGDVEVEVKRTRHYVGSARAVKKQRRVSEMSF